MQKDFHYYMTYMAARGAGIDKSRSRRIAEWAEVIDEAFNGTKGQEGGSAGTLEEGVKGPDMSNHWVAANWMPDVASIRSGRVHRTVTSTKVTRLGVSTKLGAVGRDAIPWIAFHFLPGIAEADGVPHPYRFNIGRRLQLLRRWNDGAWGRGGLSKSTDMIVELEKYYQPDGVKRWHGGATPFERMESLICWPNSQTATRMIQDTGACIQHLAGGGRLAEFLSDVGQGVAQRAGLLERSLEEMGLGPLNGEAFAEALLGVRMHVYVDTWAHQGVMGANIPATNATDSVAATFYTPGARGRHRRLPQYKVALHHGFLSRARETINLGHAQLDSFPDHPAINFKWTRVWDGRAFKRNNPQEYTAAYRAMHGVFVRAARQLGWSQARGGAFSDGQGAPVGAWDPGVINESFFRRLLPAASTGNFGAEKKWRCDKLYQEVCRRDGKTLLPFAAVNPDFGLIRHVYMTRRVDLAYFSLAALYHQRWVEREIAHGLGYGQFDTQIETMAAKCGSAGEHIRRALTELEAERPGALA